MSKKKSAREELDAAVKAFLEAGGKIEQVPSSHNANARRPLKEPIREHLDRQRRTFRIITRMPGKPRD